MSMLAPARLCIAAARLARSFGTTQVRASAPPSATHPIPTSKTSTSPLAPIGVAAALAHAADQSGAKLAPVPKLQQEFSLADRVALVSGGNRGIGLEVALALVEAGARRVYCVDLPKTPGAEFLAVQAYARAMMGPADEGEGPEEGERLEYVCADVRDQEKMWAVGREVGEREGRMDVCVAAAGVLKDNTPCLDYPAAQFREVLDINTTGVLFTAQAAGREMARFGNGGSIVLIASMSGSLTNRGHAWVSYNSSKSAVLQMARSMACELGPQRIRVNTLSPGHIYTSMTTAYLDKQPKLLDVWANMNPMGRIGRPDELRGVVAWLASDASSFCTGSDIMVTGGHQAW
ncbi:hypothetical protein K488DRAFT_88533 [Vararia minispora EC-137]|uniref:Uncharacterized protein n=1 Tax=Vararia minispora EC-137 TaxID=1314806 RepID=A0ACB8QDG1_9AGAM|nr:hypothetical protein K488DRAFT_88533 [Vararia minispora EC-137]